MNIFDPNFRQNVALNFLLNLVGWGARLMRLNAGYGPGFPLMTALHGAADYSNFLPINMINNSKI